MTLVLLDTNAYLRLALRVKPLLGERFGQKDYVLTVLKDVEDEVHRNTRLKFYNPWFDRKDIATERMAKQVRLSTEEKDSLRIAASVLLGSVRSDIARYKNDPPSPVDCRLLAFGQIRSAIVVTDDLGMHTLAKEFAIEVWHGYDLLRRMRGAKMITNDLVRDIYAAMERNEDITRTWREAKHSVFGKVFGKAPKE